VATGAGREVKVNPYSGTKRKEIGEEAIKQIKIVPDVLVTGGGSTGDGLRGC
jgi:hypothetical protein